jgi:phage portal protein BeeE
VRLIDRLTDRYRQSGYYEGMASGAAVLYTYGTDPKREQPSANLVAQAQQAYETNGIVWACILTRMMLLSEATFKLREKATKKLYGAEDVLRGRRVDLGILESPWPNGTAGELWARMEQDLSTAGGPYIAKIEDDELLRLPPREVTIVSEDVVSSGGVKYKRVLGYDWDPEMFTSGRRSSKAQFFPEAEVSAWSPYPDPLARWRGMSWLTPILREVYADSAMTTYKTQYLDHGTPITAVKYPLKMKRETIDYIVDRIAEKYGGAANVGKTLVFDQGADPILGNGLKDLDFSAVQAIGEVRIAAAAGVPPVLMGLKSAEDQSTYQTEMRRFADLTCRPLWRSACASLQKLVPNVPERGIQLWYDTSDIAALQAAETERAQVTQVNAAALLTLTQSGFTRESSIAYLASGDVSQLVPDPNAPTPGVQERETIAVADTTGVPVTGPESGGNANTTTVSKARPAVAGNPPGGGQVATKPQTGASKKPAPSSFPKPLASSSNGKGRS